jgi:hypothetical protein
MKGELLDEFIHSLTEKRYEHPNHRSRSHKAVRDVARRSCRARRSRWPFIGKEMARDVPIRRT